MTRRVLVLAPRFPLPLQSGTQIRTYHALRALAERFDVTLLALVQDGEGADEVDRLSSMGITVETVPHSQSRSKTIARFATSRQPYRTCKFGTTPFETAVAEILSTNDFDLLWVNFVQTLAVVPDDISLPVVVDEHNSDVRYWQSFLDGGPLMSLFARLNVRRIRRFRRHVTEWIDVLLSVSEGDATDARDWTTETAVHVVPNGVDVEKFQPTTQVDCVSPRVLFVGSLDVTMNTDAVSWFCETAWSAIRDTHPDATFDIVGRNPTAGIETLARAPGVELHSNVPDVVPYYDRAAVVVAPFRFGGGTKLKLLEALAMSRAVVTTPVGAVGIDIEDGVHAAIRERDDSFGDAVSSLLSNSGRRRELGATGRDFVSEHFAWERVMADGVAFLTDQISLDTSP
jgi:glycosyltransferase involved in cell wall biosynthesis